MSPAGARRALAGRGRWLWPALLLAAGALVLADRSGWLLARRPDDLRVYHGARLRVTRVIDGDTLEVEAPDALHRRPVTRVRLWGIDCPEPAGPGRAGEPLAAQATGLARRLAEAQTARLLLEPTRPRDDLGRLLAHLELPDGSMLNEALLSAGLARIDERWPHGRLEAYAEAQRAARRAGRGLWAQPRGAPAGNG